MNHIKTCDCPPNHLNCLTAKEWVKNQVSIWECFYEKRDVRDKTVHPATFPISLARRVIENFTHKGEIVFDPFCGTGTTLVAARDCGRNAIGLDLNAGYIKIANARLVDVFAKAGMESGSMQKTICVDSRKYKPDPETISLLWTSPPYADMLNRVRANKSMRDRNNSQIGKNEQYSNDERDFGTYRSEKFISEFTSLLQGYFPSLLPGSHCVVNMQDLYQDGERISLHAMLVERMRSESDYEYRNLLIWDKRNLVNGTGIFGWPSNYVSLAASFEYLLDFRKPKAKSDK